MHDLPPKVFSPAQAIVYNVLAPRALIGAIIKIPKPAEESYEKLICTPEDTATVQEIVTILGENGKLSLLFKQNYLNELGSRIETLHPLKFMTSIFCYPHLHEYMLDIFDDYFKRTGFMSGLGPSLAHETKKGKLQALLPKFAEEMKIPLEKMQPYFDRHEWEALVEFILAYQN